MRGKRLRGRWGAIVALLVLGGLGASASAVAAAPRVGDPHRGAQAFRQCAACHAVAPGQHLTGPSLARIWGRKAGTVEGFGRYSEALPKADLTWTADTLDRWLEDPAALVPGNTMTVPGVKDAQQRADLAAYLKAVSDGRAPAAPGGGMMAAGARPNLKALGPAHQVRAIRYCGDAYHVSTADGTTVPLWEFNVRLKTDASPDGPAKGAPVLIRAGMMGDRVSIVFARPEEISDAITRQC